MSYLMITMWPITHNLWLHLSMYCVYQYCTCTLYIHLDRPKSDPSWKRGVVWMYMYIVLPFPDMGAFFTVYACFHSFFYSPTPILPSHFRTPVLAFFLLPLLSHFLLKICHHILYMRNMCLHSAIFKHELWVQYNPGTSEPSYIAAETLGYK